MKEEQELATLGEMCLCGLPTGFGKSICFQMLPILFYRRHARLGFISKEKKDFSLVHRGSVT